MGKSGPLTKDEIEKLNVLLAAGLDVHQAAHRIGRSYESFRLALANGEVVINRCLMSRVKRDALAARMADLFPDSVGAS